VKAPLFERRRDRAADQPAPNDSNRLKRHPRGGGIRHGDRILLLAASVFQ
jgi:hypothetical protein